MRGQYVPVVQVPNRNGSYRMADWLSASYIDQLPNLIIQEQYSLEPLDVPYPELLSYRKYGTTDYWWVLAMYNGCVDIINDMQPGQVWAIPSYSSIQTMLSGSNVGGSTGNQVGKIVSI